MLKFRSFILIVLVVSVATLGVASQSQAGLLAPLKACPNQNLVFKNAKQKQKAIRSMYCLHNYARQAAGKKRLRLNSSLNKSADRKSGDIVRCNDFSHQACGRDFAFWIYRFYPVDGRAYSIGENLAWGSGNFRTPRNLMKGWLNSPGHRKNIINSSYREIGFGIRTGKMRGISGAHVWTAHFAYKQ